MKLRTGLLLLMTVCVMSAGAGAAITGPQQPKVKVIHKVDPVYPEEAEREGVEGKVVLDVTVEQNGEVSTAKVLSGHKLLQQAAVDAVKQWRFSNSGNAVTIQLTIAFSLTESAAGTEPAQQHALTNTHKVDAVYPEEAKRRGVQGEVGVEIKVNDTGEVTDARAVSGNDMLRQAAIDAAKQFRFSNNVHKPVTATITFNFVLGK